MQKLLKSGTEKVMGSAWGTEFPQRDPLKGRSPIEPGKSPEARHFLTISTQMLTILRMYL